LNSKSSLLVAIACLALTLAACDRLTALTGGEVAATGKPRGERPAHAVETVVVSRQAVRIVRTLTGTLEVPRTVHVHSEQAGRIIELPYFEGDSVKKGALLARLDSALLRAGLAKVVALRKQAGVNLKRLEKLVPRKLATEDELARTKTAVELARAEELLQRTLLSRTVIKAPFDARIVAQPGRGGRRRRGADR